MEVTSTGRRLLPLAVIFLAVGLSTAMASPFLTLFLTDAVHADGTQVTVFLVAAPVASVIMATAIGRLSDRLPTRRALLVATALAGCAGTAITSVERDYRALLVVALCLTSVAAAMMPQLFAYARELLEGSGRVALTVSSLRSLFSVAWVAGPPLAAVLLGAGGFTLVYGMSSAMYAVSALVVLAAVDDARPPRTGAGVPDEQGADAARSLIWVTVAVFAVTRCAGALSVQDLALFTTRDLGVGVGDAGWLLGLCAALEIPLMLGFGMLSARFPVPRLLVVGVGCGLAYMTIVSVSTQVWQLAAGQLLNAASIAALSGLGVTYVQDMLPRHPGRASTLYSNAFPIGSILAGPVLGIAQRAGYRMPFVVGAVLCAAALAVLAISLHPRSPRAGTVPAPARVRDHAGAD